MIEEEDVENAVRALHRLFVVAAQLAKDYRIVRRKVECPGCLPSGTGGFLLTSGFG